MILPTIFFLALLVVGRAQEPFGENNFVAGIVIGTVCASIVCCIPHIIWCCICRCLCKSQNKRKAVGIQSPNQLTTVETSIPGEDNRTATTRNQESTQLQVIIADDATTDDTHTYRNVAPSAPMLHLRLHDGTGNTAAGEQQNLEPQPSNRDNTYVDRTDIPPVPPPPPSYTQISLSTNPSYDISGRSAQAAVHSEPITIRMDPRCSELYESI